MPYDLFWYGDMLAINYYWQKEINLQKQKSEETDYTAWLIGKYVQIAITSAFSNNASYPKEPYSYNTVSELSIEEEQQKVYNMLDSWSMALRLKKS